MSFSIPQSKIGLWEEEELVGLSAKVIFVTKLLKTTNLVNEEKVLYSGIITSIRPQRNSQKQVFILNSSGNIQPWHMDTLSPPWRILEVSDE